MKNFRAYIRWPLKQRAEAQPKIKNVLLHTYFTSLMSLVLCVSMFLGTSYAWFTSEITNVGNEIYIGTLDVDLLKFVETATADLDDDSCWVSLKSTDVELADEDVDRQTLFSGDIRWEPGYTALETIRIENTGDLAFRYELTFTDGALATENPEEPVTDDTAKKALTVEDVAEYFDVWVYKHSGDEVVQPESYAAITAKNSGWTAVGTLADVLKGETVVLTGEMTEVRDAAQKASEANAGTTDGLATTVEYTIALHMKETAGTPAADADDTGSAQQAAVRDIMGQKITLNVKLVAYQMVAEQDSLGGTYDREIVTVSSAAALKEAFAKRSNVVLTSNIALQSDAERVTMTENGTLDGAGKKITYHGGRTGESSVGVLTTSGGKISNLTIAGSNDGRALYVTKLTSDLEVSDSVLFGAYAFNLNSSHETKNVLRFTDTDFYGWVSYANVVEHAYFNNCLFSYVLKPYADTTLRDCTFMNEGVLDVSALEDGETLTLINCTYKNQPIEKAVLKAQNRRVEVVEGNELLEVINGEVVFRSNG